MNAELRPLEEQEQVGVEGRHELLVNGEREAILDGRRLENGDIEWVSDQLTKPQTSLDGAVERILTNNARKGATTALEALAPKERSAPRQRASRSAIDLEQLKDQLRRELLDDPELRELLRQGQNARS